MSPCFLFIPSQDTVDGLRAPDHVLYEEVLQYLITADLLSFLPLTWEQLGGKLIYLCR